MLHIFKKKKHKEDDFHYQLDNLLFWDAVSWFWENNPGVLTIHYCSHAEIESITSKVPINDLKFPPGWHYDPNLGFNNPDISISIQLKQIE